MQTMYPGQPNSPQTELAQAIDDQQMTIPLLDASKLPPAPNLAVIGTGENAETVLYTGISGNDLTGVTRGFQGTAKSWPAGTKVARNFTAYDYDALRLNIQELNGSKASITHGVAHLPGGADPIPYATPTEGGLMAAQDKAKLNGIERNVFEKGIVGDGATDFTAQIQSLIDEVAAAGGGEVVFPAGTFMVSGLVLKDFVTLRGAGKRATVIKLIDGANQHVIQAGDFDINADGVTKATPVGCRSGGLKCLTIDGNKANQTQAKHGLAYYGIDLQLEEVEFRNAKGINLYTESPGQTYSVMVGQNLQYSIRHVECHDGGEGNFYYNGQSDSTMVDIVCYETDGGPGSFNAKFGSKATGCRVFGLHCWGTSEYGLINEATATHFITCHVESATIAKVWMKTATYFLEGRVYQAGTANAAPAFLIEPGVGFHVIKSLISNIDVGVRFAGSDGGHSLYELMMYSNNPSAVIFQGTVSITNFITARLRGAVTTNIFQVPNMKQVLDSVSKFITNGMHYHFFTDGVGGSPSFGVEHTSNPDSFISVLGGSGIAGPAVVARGSGADYDLRLIPKGNGRVRFGTFTSSSDAPIVGYIEVKDANGTVRKLAVIG